MIGSATTPRTVALLGQFSGPVAVDLQSTVSFAPGAGLEKRVSEDLSLYCNIKHRRSTEKYVDF